MKTVLSCVLLVLLAVVLLPWFLSTAAAQTPLDLSGSWTGIMGSPNRSTIPLKLALNQKGSQVYGRVIPENGSEGPFRGEINGITMTFSLEFTYQGCTIAINGSGIADEQAFLLEYSGSDCSGVIEAGKLNTQKVSGSGNGPNSAISEFSSSEPNLNRLTPHQTGTTLVSFFVTTSLLIVIAGLALMVDARFGQRITIQESLSGDLPHEN